VETLIPGPPGHDRTQIPIYKLYGYGTVWTPSDPLYCETIAAQEKLHNWHVTRHKHMDLFQILFLESGQVTVTLDGDTRTLGARRLVLVPQMVVHEFVFRPDSRGYILTLTYALLREACQRFGLGLGAVQEPAVLAVGTAAPDQLMTLSLQRLNREYRSPHSPQRGPMLESLLSLILVWIHRRHHPAGRPDTAADPGSRYLAQYADLIEAHYGTQHQVEWYARRIGVTAAHLNVIVRTLAGKSALQLIHERLLLEARRELIYTARPISRIADGLGFADPGYFTRFFKRLSGLSPKDFRAGAGV
jgi:AraC family transcriptional activator of pobA